MVNEGALAGALIEVLAEMQTRKPLYQEVERLKSEHSHFPSVRLEAQEEISLLSVVQKELQNGKGEYRQVGAHDGFNVYARRRGIEKEGRQEPFVYHDFTTMQVHPSSLSPQTLSAVSHFSYLTDRTPKSGSKLEESLILQSPQRIAPGITQILKGDEIYSPIPAYIGVTGAIGFNIMVWYLHSDIGLSLLGTSSHSSIGHWAVGALSICATLIGGSLLTKGIQEHSKGRFNKELKEGFHHTTGWEAIQIIAQEIEQVDRK